MSPARAFVAQKPDNSDESRFDYRAYTLRRLGDFQALRSIYERKGEDACMQQLNRDIANAQRGMSKIRSRAGLPTRQPADREWQEDIRRHVRQELGLPS